MAFITTLLLGLTVIFNFEVTHQVSNRRLGQISRSGIEQEYFGFTSDQQNDGSSDQQNDGSAAKFSADLYSNIVKNANDKNIIVSPTSVHTALGLALFGAKGRTADELQRGLRITSNDRDEVASKFRNLLESAQQSQQLRIANRMFVSSNYRVNPGFNEVALKTFKSEAQSVNFVNKLEAATMMNRWVERETENKIKNLFSPQSLDGREAMILVNAIYFKGEWEIPFTSQTTRSDRFFNFGTSPVEVSTMWNSDRFKYGEFSDLDATGLEMYYKNSGISMLILLPNQPQGLSSLEDKLKDIDVLQLSQKMKPESVDVLLPKFEIEFEKSLVEDLMNMGIQRMFTENAEFGNLFEEGQLVKVDDVVHKAYINVNEAGSEAGASTYLKIVPLSLNLNQKYFKADHPFVFVIKDKSNVYFIGHVVKF